MEKCKVKNKAARDCLILSMSKLVSNISYSYNLSKQDREDFYQECMLQVVKAIDSYDENLASLETHVFNYIRAAKKVFFSNLNKDSFESTDDYSSLQYNSNYLESVSFEERFRCLSQIETLCINMYISGYTGKEMAKELNITHRLVRYHLETAKSKMMALKNPL